MRLARAALRLSGQAWIRSERPTHTAINRDQPMVTTSSTLTANRLCARCVDLCLCPASLDTMDYHRVRPSELEEAHELLASNGWHQRIQCIERFRLLVEASQVAEVAVLEGQVVGFVRAITDGQSNGYLSMLVVAPAHRRKGIGRQLVERALGSNAQGTWVLRAGRSGAAEFFASLGFEPSSLAMERRRA